MILVAGGSGYLGSLVCAALHGSGAEVVLPVREPHTPAAVQARIAAEVAALGLAWSPERVTVLPYPRAADGLSELLPGLRELAPREIVHCAGSLSYFHRERLQAANVDHTGELLELGRALGVERFVYLSTAFSSGYVDGTIGEALHPEPAADPTEYTRSKRAAEHLVAGSGLPFQILRPSIVIGHSGSGRYAGRPYGLYQLWAACERFLCRRHLSALHLVAPRAPLPLIHQDAFQAAFLATRSLPSASIVHLCSRAGTLPTMRQLWQLWIERVARPREVEYFESLDQVPRERLGKEEQLLLRMTEVNLEIGAREWRFASETLEGLRARDGLDLVDATVDTVAMCQEAYMAGSPRIQAFLAETRGGT